MRRPIVNALLMLPLILAAPLSVADEPAPDACAGIEQQAADLTVMRDADPAQAIEQGERTLAAAVVRTVRCDLGEALLLAAIGGNLRVLGQTDDAVTRYAQSIERLPATANAAQRATVHRGAGVAFGDSGAFELALEQFLLALAASRADGDVLEAAKTAGNVGNLYTSLGNYDRSQAFHEQALGDFEAAAFAPGIAGTLINLGALAAKRALVAGDVGDTAGQRREYRRQRDLNTRALEIFTALGNDRGIAYAASNIAMALDELGDSEQALAQHERALALRSQLGDIHGVINSYGTMSTTLVRLGRYDEAQARLEQAGEHMPDDNFGLGLLIAQRHVELAEARDDIRDALKWQREVTRLVSAMSSESQAARVAELQSRFDSDQQKSQIELLQRAAEVRELQLGRQRMLLNAGLVIGALVIVVLIALFSRLRMGRRSARELERVARTDPLTRLANRRDMVERIIAEIQRAIVEGRRVTLLMVDIDRFKAINDRHGHGVGDAVLVEVTRRLGGDLRGRDVLGRWGGEEFLILLPETGLEGGGVLAEKLRLEVQAMPVRVGVLEIPVSVTIGVAEYVVGMSLDACVNAADEAMYAGKRDGGNRAVLTPTKPAARHDAAKA